MDHYFLRQLSPITKILVAEIEGVILNPIQLILRSEKENFGCNYESAIAKIYAPRLDRLNDGSMIHELLHLKRLSVDRVPTLNASLHRIGDIQFQDNLRGVDNAIEHLAIVHCEIGLWPSRKGYWGAILHRELRAISTLDSNDRDVKGHAILCWALAQRAVPSRKLLRAWSAYLDQCGLRKFADGCASRILNTESKEEIAHLMLDVYEISREDVEVY